MILALLTCSLLITSLVNESEAVKPPKDPKLLKIQNLLKIQVQPKDPQVQVMTKDQLHKF